MLHADEVIFNKKIRAKVRDAPVIINIGTTEVEISLVECPSRPEKYIQVVSTCDDVDTVCKQLVRTTLPMMACLYKQWQPIMDSQCQQQLRCIEQHYKGIKHWSADSKEIVWFSPETSIR